MTGAASLYLRNGYWLHWDSIAGVKKAKTHALFGNFSALIEMQYIGIFIESLPLYHTQFHYLFLLCCVFCAKNENLMNVYGMVNMKHNNWNANAISKQSAIGFPINDG